MDQGRSPAQRLLALRRLRRTTGSKSAAGEGPRPRERTRVREPGADRYQGLQAARPGHRGRSGGGVMSDDDRRMIEHAIPLQAVNYASGKEKKHPRRHVELIHQWPARRPRSASRVAIAAALLRIPKTEGEFNDRLKLLEELAPYECSPKALEKA